MKACYLLALLCLTGIRVSGFAVSACRHANGRNHCFLLLEKLTVQDLVSEPVLDVCIGHVVERLELPIPEPVIAFVLTQMLSKIGSDISSDSMNRLEEALQAQDTATTFDNVPLQEIDSLALQIAEELNPNIDIPILNEEQELEVLTNILKIVLLFLTTTEEDRRASVYSAVAERHLPLDLLTVEGRQELVKALNQVIDVPILNEDQEEALLEAAVETCSVAVQKLLPPSFLQALRGEAPAGLEQTKEFIIQEINESVDILGLTEAQERDIIRLFVNLIVDSYVDQTTVGVVLLNSSEQTAFWKERKEGLDSDIQLGQRRYRREQFHFSMQRNRMEKRLAETAKRAVQSASGNATKTT